MQRNLDGSFGLFFSQRLLLALVDAGLARDTAYRLVQTSAMRAWDEEVDFQQLVRSDGGVTAVLDASQLDDVFDMAAYTRHVDTIFERLHTLVQKGEPAHV
jgi:adenylosuccinate lyase